ncbi:MAG: dihydrofolate reductase family protein [Nitrospira sp.]|nr:dihydrofolate reductase family protein [Nitrospira sp.]
MQITTLYGEVAIPSAPYLTDALLATYDGDLCFGDSLRRPMVICNFVQTLDGIVSFKIPGKSGGAEISGHNQEDAFIMAVLRACADAVMIGEETFRNAPGHVWTAGAVFPALADEFRTLRKQVGKISLHPLNVIVSGRGHVDLNQSLFRQTEIKSLVLTTQQGAARLRQQYGATLPATVRVLPGNDVLAPADMMTLLRTEYGIQLLLHEGGPSLLAAFLEQRWIDELFLTVSPQIVGRGPTGERPSFSGPLKLPPEQAQWGKLLSVKCAAKSGHLFLRYQPNEWREPQDE